MHCNSTITLDQLVHLQQFGEVLSGIGFLLLIPLLLTKLIVPTFRQFPSRLSTLFVVANVGLNVTILTGYSQNWTQLWIDKLNKKPSPTFCRLQGMAFQFFASAEVLLWLEIAIVMWFVLVKKISFVELSKYEHRFHIAWFSGALLMTGIPSYLHPAVPQLGASYCWLSEDNSFVYQIAFLHTEMLISLVVGSTFVFKVVRKLSMKVSSDSAEDSFAVVIRSYVLR